MWNSSRNRSKKQNLDELDGKLDELDGLVKNHGITLGTFGSEGSGYEVMMDFVRDFRILKKALLESKDLNEARNKIEEMDKFLKKLYEQGPNYPLLDNMRHFEKILKQKITGYVEDCGEGDDVEFYNPSTHECINGEIKGKFGKKKKKKRKKKTVRKSKVKKVSSDLKKRCKKHKIRLSVKRGSKRVPKSEKVLKKQLAKKMKTMKKKKAATKRKTVKRRRKRRSGYGASKGRSSLGMGPYPGSLMMRTPYFEMKA